MISPSRISLPDSFGASPSDLVESLLADQQSLTAVERFSEAHTAGIAPAQGLYRDLIPLREPGPGEQYAFEVDLDRCTGCKACVTACHSLNGLDEEETWRSVGLLQKVATPESPAAQQHVTTACHHCLEPGCAQGCPTLAYEKDPDTGIVRHLDDQCFGCQYCVLKCPYDVPQYNAAKGIVRKCDLCIGRLRAGEAPACAQACPTGAIRVTVVKAAAVREAPEATFDLPGAPDPLRVKPTTRYVTAASSRLEGLAPADVAQVRPEHAHLPLVFMLVATQAAAGYWALLALGALLSPLSLNVAAGQGAPPSAFPLAELAGFLGVQAALGLSLLHLGRPWLAWKAFLGWRRSWLSREVIAFTVLAGATGFATFAAGVGWFMGEPLPTFLRLGVAGAVLLSVAAALHASAMVYRDTPRVLWATRATLWRFVLTATLTGIPAFLFIVALAEPFTAWTNGLLIALPLAFAAKIALESRVFLHRASGSWGPLWKAAALISGPLRRIWVARLFLGTLGGVALPLSMLTGLPDGLAMVWLALTFILLTAGELLERYLFFTTAVAPRMPGGRA